MNSVSYSQIQKVVSLAVPTQRSWTRLQCRDYRIVSPTRQYLFLHLVRPPEQASYALRTPATAARPITPTGEFNNQADEKLRCPIAAVARPINRSQHATQVVGPA